LGSKIAKFKQWQKTEPGLVLIYIFGNSLQQPIALLITEFFRLGIVASYLVARKARPRATSAGKPPNKPCE
jgi:hypothetical protein